MAGQEQGPVETKLKIDDGSVFINGFELPGVMAIAYEEPDWSGIGYLTVKIRIDSREISKGEL